ncbi:DUF2264 domain-containing protein [Kitasatospora sp. NPDC049258]|uniref:DUF2264 domain-containing protein n=1 Tax=Kitasatospora sp. NPDC049258 TaxID=3155394 RepID=UPI0034346E98
MPQHPHSLRLPPEDRALSPYTGWTRAHWEAAADRLLAAVDPYRSPGRALISLPGARPSWSGPRSDGLEGFARTFLLAALRVAGADGADPGGLLERYADGLRAGTRSPTGERDLAGGDGEAWPLITDRGQAMVEAASIANALRLTRPWLWDRLADPVRERVGGWLADALHRTPNDNNWWLFPVAVGGFLAEAGLETEAARAAVDRGLAAIDRWYLGDGWYTDGRPRAFDHYNGWALHLYPVLHAHLAGDDALLARYGDRLAAHLVDQARLFGADGAPVHQGRSLSYRFAAAAPLWAGALTGRTPLTPGTTRRLASGALRYFLDRGALGADGLLGLGWHGPYPPMVQPYSGPASPYWAASGFLGLLLPAGHPVWTDVEQPGPAETADAVRAVPGPGWLIQSTAADGLVRLHNHGSDDQPADAVRPDDPLYAQLAHSTATGPTATGPDNHLALLVGGAATERGRITPLGTGDGWAASAHRPRAAGAELPGATVTSVTLAHGAEEVRAHLVGGAPAGTVVRHGGWPVAGAQVSSGTAAPLAWARADQALATELRAEHGFTEVAVERPPGGTAFGPRAAVPVLTGAVGDGPTLFACAVRLTGLVPPPPPFTALAVRVEPAEDGFLVRATWPDGTGHRALLREGAVSVTVADEAPWHPAAAPMPGPTGPGAGLPRAVRREPDLG